MALQIPVRLPILLPAMSEDELSKLYFKLKTLKKNLFCDRVRLMIAREFKRRDDPSVEPSMEEIALVDGFDLADSIEFIRIARQWKLPPKSKRFISRVCDYAGAMAQACLIMLNSQVRTMAVHQTLLKNTDTNEVLLRASECASMLGCSESHLKKLVDEESFPRPIRVANKRLWTESSVQEYIRNKIEENYEN